MELLFLLLVCFLLSLFCSVHGEAKTREGMNSGRRGDHENDMIGRLLSGTHASRDCLRQV